MSTLLVDSRADVPFGGPESVVVAGAEHVPKNLVPHASAVLCRDRDQRFQNVQIDADGWVALVFQRCPLSRSTTGTGQVRRALQGQHPRHLSHRPAYRPVETVAPHARPLRVKPAASAPYLRYR